MSGAEYQRQYRAQAPPERKLKENQRNKAWWRAHRQLAKEFPQRFYQLYAEEKRKLDENVRAAGE